MALRTDYKDDLLDTSVNTQRKYRMATNDDGTVSFVDETVYTQNGDTFGSAEVNTINEAVNMVNESLNVDTSELSEDYTLNALLQILAEKYFPNKTYLYNNGNECEELTGGWTTYTLNGGSVTKNDDCMTLHVDDNSTQRANVFTENYFDLTNYSKLIVTANALTTGLKAIQLVNESGNPTSLKETYGNEAYSPDSPIELNITSYNGRYRIQFYTGAYNGADTLSVYSVEVK